MPAHDEVARMIIRTELRPGDIGAIVQFHGLTYAREYGFDHTFEAYVAGPLADFACRHSERERIWIAERDERLIGCVAIVEMSPRVAQLRWFLVDASARGAGLGKKLLKDAIAFCRERGYDSVILWTVSTLTAAAHLYTAAGFAKVEEKPGRHWGVDVVEEKYEFDFAISR
jgi:N-acetylglutamate synthase-like GNAT family acetyltransferase